MKYYNLPNYIRYKTDVATAVKKLPKIPIIEYTNK